MGVAGRVLTTVRLETRRGHLKMWAPATPDVQALLKHKKSKSQHRMTKYLIDQNSSFCLRGGRRLATPEPLRLSIKAAMCHDARTHEAR
eukprot:55988-Prymnesium_polylepis.2